jgi:inosose dehydratase
LKAAAERVEQAAERARAAGVTAAFHPHTATYIEGPEEVAAFLDATDPGLVNIAFDTGHCIVGGGDPVAFVQQSGDRIAHLHLKDVDPSVLARVRSQEWTVEEAWDHGLFCEFGTGAVDFAAVLAALPGYDGWAVVEQDRVAVQVGDLPAVRAVEERNLVALKGV